MAPLLGDNALMGAYAGGAAVDPVVAAATAHLSNPVVMNFVSKASLAECKLIGTHTPAMALGSFASGASGFPFAADASIDLGITPKGSAGEFFGIYMTDVTFVTNGNPVFFGNSISAGQTFRGITSSDVRCYYGDDSSSSATAADGSYICSAGLYRVNDSLIDTLVWGSDSGVTTYYLGGYATSGVRASECNMVYMVYGSAVTTTAASAAAAIHAAMVEGAP